MGLFDFFKKKKVRQTPLSGEPQLKTCTRTKSPVFEKNQTILRDESMIVLLQTNSGEKMIPNKRSA